MVVVCVLVIVVVAEVFVLSVVSDEHAPTARMVSKRDIRKSHSNIGGVYCTLTRWHFSSRRPSYWMTRGVVEQFLGAFSIKDNAVMHSFSV